MSWLPTFAAIRRTLDRFHRASERMPVGPFFALSLDPLWITALDGHLLRVNPAFIVALGQSEPHLLACNILDLIHPGDRPAAVAAIAGLARGNPIAGLESRFCCAGGEHEDDFTADGFIQRLGHRRRRAGDLLLVQLGELAQQKHLHVRLDAGEIGQRRPNPVRRFVPNGRLGSFERGAEGGSAVR